MLNLAIILFILILGSNSRHLRLSLWPGWIYDVTDDFNIPYLVLGCIMICGGLVILIIPCRDGSLFAVCRRTRTGTTDHMTRNRTMLSMETGNALLDEQRDTVPETPVTPPPKSSGSPRKLDLDACQGRLRTWSAGSHLQAGV